MAKSKSAPLTESLAKLNEKKDTEIKDLIGLYALHCLETIEQKFKSQTNCKNQ